MDENQIKKNPGWTISLGFKMSKSGTISSTPSNIKRLILGHPDLSGVAVYDDFADRLLITRPISRCSRGPFPRVWNDRDTADLAVRLDEELSVDPIRIEALDRAIDAAAREPQNRRNDLASALRGLAARQRRRKHESKAFAEILDAMHVPASGVEAAMLRRWFCGAAARVLEPGVKFDSMLILIGSQRCGKSRFCSQLVESIAPIRYYTDTIANVSTKEAPIVMRDCWIWEWAELDQLSGPTVERIKAFLSTRIDEYREAFARRTIQIPRHTAIIGTTNQRDFLRDLTGSRRFWIIETCRGGEKQFKRISRETIADAWGQAALDAITWLEGPRTSLPPWVMTLEEEEACGQIAKKSTVEDPWIDLLAEKLSRISIQDARWGVPTDQLYQWIGISPQDRNLSTAQRLGRTLTALGWHRAGQPCRGTSRYVKND